MAAIILNDFRLLSFFEIQPKKLWFRWSPYNGIKTRFCSVNWFGMYTQSDYLYFGF